MTGRYIKFYVLTEARKVLRGKPTKVSEASLLRLLADYYVSLHGRPKKA